MPAHACMMAGDIKTTRHHIKIVVISVWEIKTLIISIEKRGTRNMFHK